MSKTLAALAGATALATVGAEAIFEDLWTQSETCGAGTLATIARQYQVPVGTCMSWGANNELGFKTKAVCAGSPLGLTYEKYNALSDPSCKGAPYATTVVPANTCGSSAAPVPGLYPDGVPSNDYASAQISAATCEPITDDIFTISLYETSDGSCGGQKIGGGFPGIGAVLTANAGCIKFLSNSSQVGKFFGPDGITAMQLTVPRGNEVTLSVYKNSVCSQDSLLHAASGDAEDYRPQPTCKTMTVRTGDPAGGPVFSRTYDAHILKYTGGSAFNPGASGSALTPGEITGIVTGVLLLVGIPLLLLAAVAGFFIVRKVRRGGYARQDAAMARDIRSGLTDGGNSSVTASYTDL